MAISTRWSRSPVTRPDQSPSIVARHLSSRPSSAKNEIAASSDSTTMPTLSTVEARRGILAGSRRPMSFWWFVSLYRDAAGAGRLDKEPSDAAIPDLVRCPRDGPHPRRRHARRGEGLARGGRGGPERRRVGFGGGLEN